jgi:Protein of unknown function (DUF2924)
MDESVIAQIEELQRLTIAALRIKYYEVFGEESRSANRAFLFRRIAYRLQARAEGDLSERARRRALEIADDSDLRLRVSKAFFGHSAGSKSAAEPHPAKRARDTRLPIAGTFLTRQFENRRIVVTVLADGFEYQGKRYRSLSAIAREVTGTRWNGLSFFGLAGRHNG